MKFTNKLAHYGDMLAIPFYFIVLFYFYQIENKTPLEMLIMAFIFMALLFDVAVTFIFLTA